MLAAASSMLSSLACDRIARSTCHFLDVLDDLQPTEHRVHQLQRTDRHRRTVGSGYRVIIGAIADKLERSLIVERVRAGMRRAKLEGRSIGRRPLELDRQGIQRYRKQGQSLRKIAKSHLISPATVQRVLRESTLGKSA